MSMPVELILQIVENMTPEHITEADKHYFVDEIQERKCRSNVLEPPELVAIFGRERAKLIEKKWIIMTE